MYPATTPGDSDLAAMVLRRLREVDDDTMLFPGPRGGWARRSNYGRTLWDKAAATIGWTFTSSGTRSPRGRSPSPVSDWRTSPG
jgi:hypothetical protein